MSNLVDRIDASNCDPKVLAELLDEQETVCLRGHVYVIVPLILKIVISGTLKGDNNK